MSRPALTAAQGGFAYLALLICVATLGVGLAATGEVWRTAQQRAKERELLFVGEQFRRAIGRYYESTPGAAKRFPRKLEDLIEDKRYPGIRRYLRQVYPDPITDKPEWGLVQSADGGVAGVYSLSQDPPLKTANFGRQNISIVAEDKYSGWQFVYVPGDAAARPAAVGGPVPLPGDIQAPR